MKEKEQMISLSVRIPLDLFVELSSEIESTTQNKSEFVRESIEEKLCNDNPELLKNEIKFLEQKLIVLQERVIQCNTKKKDFTKIPEIEKKFLQETKVILEQNPTFLLGRIKLYKNTFGKHYHLSKQEFWELLDKV